MTATFSGMIDRVRLEVSDQLETHLYSTTGDKNRSLYELPHSNAYISGLTLDVVYLASGEPVVSGNVGVSLASGGLAMPTGEHPSTNELRFTYRAAAFSQDEIASALSAEGNSIPGACAAITRNLMFDGVKRANWAMAPGQKYDDTEAMQHLREMRYAQDRPAFNWGFRAGF